MMGLSSTMANLAACCRVVFSGSLYPLCVAAAPPAEGVVVVVVVAAVLIFYTNFIRFKLLFIFILVFSLII
jgi:hypothetical protein